MGLPGGSDGKESACNVGDLGLILGSGRSSGEGNGNPLQYSGLENPMDKGSCRIQSMGSQRVGHDWTTSLSFFHFSHISRYSSVAKQSHCCKTLSIILLQNFSLSWTETLNLVNTESLAPINTESLAPFSTLQPQGPGTYQCIFLTVLGTVNKCHQTVFVCT